MPPGVKLPPFVRALLLKRGLAGPSHHHPVAPQYGHLRPQLSKSILRPRTLDTATFTTNARPRVPAGANASGELNRLAEPFRYLLRCLDFAPILRGARAAFSSSASSSGQNLQRSLHRSNGAVARSINQWTRHSARPQTGLPPSQLYGPGLQTARNFSSGAPKFAYLITNAPLALRAGGDELRDGLGKTNKAGDNARLARRSPRRSAPLTQSQRHNLAVRVGTSSLRANEKASKASKASTSYQPTVTEKKAAAASSDLDLYFPEVPVTVNEAERRSSSAIAELIIPMEPDVLTILAHTEVEASLERPYMLDRHLRDVSQLTTEAYHLHKIRLRTVWRLLEDLESGHLSFGGKRRFVRDSDVEFLPETLHHVGYKVRVRGFSADEIKSLLVDRLGVEHGKWFGQMVRDVPHQTPNPTPGHALEDSVSSTSSVMNGSGEDDGFLVSPPAQWAELADSHAEPAAWDLCSNAETTSSEDLESVGTVSSSSLHSPPQMSFSAAFSSLMHPPGHYRHDDHDDDWLQDSRL